MEDQINNRLKEVEKRFKTLKNICITFICLFVVGLISLSFSGVDKFGIIRVKGIIVEDEKGRDRILIGSPIPFSDDRVRTDTALVKKYWASKLFPKNPSKFMEFYKNYYHATDGIVIMNENGFDRVLLGDKLADANTGKRNFEAAGISWNDRNGFELGGAGVNTTKEGKARGVIGLDDSDGEALHIVTLEDGTKAIIIGGENGRLMIGMSNKNGEWFQNKESFVGMKFFNNTGELIWEQQMNTKKVKQKKRQ